MMTLRFRASALLLTAALALSACAQGGLSNDTSAGFNGQGGIGSASDPTSVAFFNQSIGDRVLFAVDQSTLSVEAQSLLTAQAQWLLTNREYSALIEGHADEQGTREYNLALGARRASAVRDFLVSQGVSDSRLSTVSYGKERPIEICSNEACYAQNRRAVTVVSAGPGV
jgi:peptidoglycan-associated lipoprotein